ncbi:MAG: tungsten formylmethanofuran dehydrogenase [Deltaproteobacteria bacterium]|nr:tungsten formylmethanofuran dehydrogenase [Deltaproteobacteria bacterium]
MGCSICVDFCPTNVLEMRGTVVAVKDLAACTRCQLCDLRCPDFAIQVFD